MSALMMSITRIHSKHLSPKKQKLLMHSQVLGAEKLALQHGQSLLTERAILLPMARLIITQLTVKQKHPALKQMAWISCLFLHLKEILFQLSVMMLT